MRHFTSWMLLPGFGRVLELQYRNLVGRRLAATALAIRLYEPYLRTQDERPFGYWPHDHPAKLYGVGLDGTDDGGCYGVDEKGKPDEDLMDIVWFLDSDPRDVATPPDRVLVEPDLD